MTVVSPDRAQHRYLLGEDQGEDWQSYRCYLHTRLVVDIVRQFPRLEELYLWANEYDLDALFALDQQANEAYFKSDSKFFEGLLSDKFVMHEDAQRMDKAAVIKMIAGNKCDVKSWKLEEPGKDTFASVLHWSNVT